MRTILRTTATLALLTAAACSGDGGTGSGDDTLSRAEIEALNRALLGVGTGIGIGGMDGGGMQNRVPLENSGSINFEFDETGPCEAGGTARVDGTMSITWDDVARTSSIGTDFAFTPNDCGNRTDRGVVRITGDPDIDVTFDAASQADELTSMVITEAGAFTWEKPGASGRCTLDVRAELNPATQVVTVSGSFCGVDVSGTYTES